MSHDGYERDRKITLANRERLRDNVNLRYWYETLYDFVFCDEHQLKTLNVLEIGSGASPLKALYPHVTTSDVLPLDHVELVFDCHEIREVDAIADRSLDILTMTNVLHHLRDPLDFLKNAACKMKRGGRIYMTEPYFSALSYPMYKVLHHEPVDFSIDHPQLHVVEGPLSTSNQAMPHMIFLTRKDWLAELKYDYKIKRVGIRYFTGLAYPLTGGISRTFPVPHWLYKLIFSIDLHISSLFPKLYASFFVIRLEAR